MMNAIGKRIGSFTFFGTASTTATSTVATSTPSTTDTFATGLIHAIFLIITQWLADAANGIAKIVTDLLTAKRVQTTELCVDDICVTRDQFAAVFGASASSSASVTSTTTPAANDPSTTSSQSSDGYGAGNTPPVITLNGNASSTIGVDSTYVDLGANVTDDHDHNLGIHFFVNGTEVPQIKLDTSTTTTYLIEYRTTDTGGLTGTALRTVTVVAHTHDNTPITDASTTPPAVNNNASPAANDNQASSTPQTATTTAAATIAV